MISYTSREKAHICKTQNIKSLNRQPSARQKVRCGTFLPGASVQPYGTSSKMSVERSAPRGEHCTGRRMPQNRIQDNESAPSKSPSVLASCSNTAGDYHHDRKVRKTTRSAEAHEPNVIDSAGCLGAVFPPEEIFLRQPSEIGSWKIAKNTGG